jgi:uncharacterized RmlC-like cupin family protein
LWPSLLAAGALLVGARALLVAADDPRVPIDNDQVRVVRALDQPHKAGAMHEHKPNRVMVYLQAGRQNFNYPDGRKKTLTWKAGDVKWSPGGGMHISEIVSDSPVTIVELEVKKDGDPAKAVHTALDPLKVDPKVYKLEFENSQVRVIRVKIPAHGRIPLHEHVLNRVVVYLSDQNSRMTTPDGKTEVAQHKAGEVSWGGAVKHTEENLNDQAFEGILVEFKS